MAKLIKILAASVGGGLVLGAGIRLVEALAAQIPVSGVDLADTRLAERLGELENRLLSLERPEFGKQAADVSAVRTQLDSEDPQIDVLGQTTLGQTTLGQTTLGQTTLRLRGELRDWLEESVAVRMAEVETRLRTESEHGRKQILDAFAETVQTRVMQRISSLEEEVAGQSAAMSELRECSLRTERSVHKLLGGLDRLIVKYPPPAEETEEALNPAPAEAGSVALPVTAPAESDTESGPLPGD